GAFEPGRQRAVPGRAGGEPEQREPGRQRPGRPQPAAAAPPAAKPQGQQGQQQRRWRQRGQARAGERAEHEAGGDGLPEGGPWRRIEAWTFHGRPAGDRSGPRWLPARSGCHRRGRRPRVGIVRTPRGAYHPWPLLRASNEMPSAPPDLAALIRARLPEPVHALVPPPCLLDMQGEVVEYEDGRALTMRFPVLPRYRNPLGNMQGGFIVAALDNTIGPF